MCVVYYYGVALLALLAVSRVTAAPTTEPPTEEDCGKLVKPLPADKFNTVFGEWILIEAFSDDEGYAEKLKMGKSSKVELRATSSDKSVLFKQGNMIDDTCVNYSIMNMSIVENTIQRLKDNGISKAHFLQACPDCLVMHFSNTITVAGVPIRMVRSFYIFGKTGKLHESELEPIRKQAECLKFPQPAQFIYDGVAEFCPETKKSETK
ncbi:saxitoxin and tetrodotoxin-binding protein 1 [Salmo salar]|uniref:Saxitoxin and tetrodotoxin-binding protein 1 n=1 Tax=Salmo salar TaxID=8030 RepID=A0A1S3SU51_SALSA|nr:saxitoxin and tetrodotoxin-binding protein 1 [Salmo salar]|eukprot:XP_014067863.1 PREDICTED: saxitoxin and tetrodotoxin-binding protein 1-like [Salmo salar]